MYILHISTHFILIIVVYVNIHKLNKDIPMYVDCIEVSSIYKYIQCNTF